MILFAVVFPRLSLHFYLAVLFRCTIRIDSVSCFSAANPLIIMRKTDRTKMNKESEAAIRYSTWFTILCLCRSSRLPHILIYTLAISPLALDDGNFSLSTPLCTRWNIARKIEKSLCAKFEERFTSTQIDYCAVARVNELLLNYAKNDVSRKLAANPHTHTGTPSTQPRNPFFSLNVRSFFLMHRYWTRLYSVH